MNLKDFDIKRTGIIPRLILLQAVILLPLWFYIPAWVSAATIGLLSAKYLIHKYKIKLPYWLILGLVLAALAGVFLQFKTISGRDAGISLISMMYAFKLLEAKSYRDAALILFISFFIMVTAFLFSQDIWMGLYMIASVGLILFGLVELNSLPLEPKPTESATPRGFGKTSLITLLQALPIMLVLFFLFPRLPGPLWNMPSKGQAGSGIDDSMSPGDISSLSLFDEIAFRVSFKGEAPSTSQMYWRGMVFSNFDGYVWKEGRRGPINFEDRAQGVLEYEYKVQMEPTKRRWLFGLEQLYTPPEETFLFSDYTWRRAQKIMTGFQYEAKSYRLDQSQANLPQWVREQNLQLPSNGNQRSKEWAQNLYQQSNNSQTYINQVLQYIRQQPYFYTLTPEILADNIVDDFWFNTKEGFCEHYSSAFVFMMRAAGIPARVVTGYQGGEYNPYGDYYIVRQARAHAWSEVWIEGAGWQRVDPTSAIDPSRVELDLRQRNNLRDSWLDDVDFPIGQILPDSFLQKLSLRWDAIQNYWNETLMNYDRASQYDWLEKLGIKNDKLRYLGYGLVATIILAGLFFGLWILKNSKRRSQIEKYFDLMQRKLNKKGFAVVPSEGPQDTLLRLQREQPEIAQAYKKAFTAYIRLRYQSRYSSKMAMEEFVEQVKSL